MFKDGQGFKKVYIPCGYTDLGYGVDGFAAIIKNQYQLDPYDQGTLFLFCGRRSDRIKGSYGKAMDSFCYINAYQKAITNGHGL